jgi:NAD(P)H-dependent flavin oxidoreductase YrpB (nitropropane dioxygenase family)
MRTEICDLLEIEFPIFAFSHCRDVVAAVSEAGGLGVLGAVAPTPVLAAGGIADGRQVVAALAAGAQGAWTGSIWLTVEESHCTPEQRDSYLQAKSGDAVRSRAFTGKPARMLRNDWTQAWERSDTPDPLGMPLQGMVAMDAIIRAERYPKSAQPVAFSPVGQVVGQMNEVRSVRDVVRGLVEEYLDAIERLQSLGQGEDA